MLLALSAAAGTSCPAWKCVHSHLPMSKPAGKQLYSLHEIFCCTTAALACLSTQYVIRHHAQLVIRTSCPAWRYVHSHQQMSKPASEQLGCVHVMSKPAGEQLCCVLVMSCCTTAAFACISMQYATMHHANMQNASMQYTHWYQPLV